MKKFLQLVILLGLFFLMNTETQAASEFETKYASEYKVRLDGTTTVTLDISLLNLLSNVYADKFSLSVGFTDVENIKVRDAIGLIEPEIVSTDNQTTIRFQFIDKVVGKNKVNRFSISYETRDIATKNGSVWEVNVPQLETDKGISDQSVSLIVPSEFGTAAFITPDPDLATNNPPGIGTSNTYNFGAAKLGNKAISAVFGTTQYMRFNLIYHLESNSPVGQRAEIALPPDTNYQKMIYESIQPKPENVLVDQDGNWLAQYWLSPGQKLDISTTGVTRINFQPDAVKLGEGMRVAYTRSSELWQVNNPQIQVLANQLRTPSAIYDYVTDFLSYDYNKLTLGNERVGAIGALNQPLAAICTEFTDLFLTLTRAAGIPARELEGYAFTSNDKLRPLSLTQDVLHAWPEYYNESTQRWIQVDPTWGNTTGGIDYFNKLDLNHFVFVIHGLDPRSPLPAGAYKVGGVVNKDVKVIASDPVVMPSEDLAFEAKYIPRLLGGRIELGVKNQGMVSAGGQISIQSSPAGIISEIREVFVPPYGMRVLVMDTAKGIDLRTPKNIIIKYDNREITVKVQSEEKYDKAFKMAAAVIGFGVLAAGAYAASRLLLRRRGR